MNMPVADDCTHVTATSLRWEKICGANDVLQYTGVRALVNDRQIAVFRLRNKLYAVDAVDPFTRCAVLSRGIVGDLKNQPVVASPIYKQHFNLESGQCLEDAAVVIATFPVREKNGFIEIGMDTA